MSLFWLLQSAMNSPGRRRNDGGIETRPPNRIYVRVGFHSAVDAGRVLARVRFIC